MIHTIKKIAEHRHTKTVASLIIVVSFFAYFANYKPSFASEKTIHTDYVSDIHIESTNSSDISLASSSDYVVLTYKLRKARALSYQSVDIFDKKAEIRCAEEKIKKDVLLNCRAILEITPEDASVSAGESVPFKLDLTYVNRGKENITFEMVKTTDDSFVILSEEVAESVTEDGAATTEILGEK
jgi:hypothetical protein